MCLRGEAGGDRQKETERRPKRWRVRNSERRKQREKVRGRESVDMHTYSIYVCESVSVSVCVCVCI